MMTTPLQTIGANTTEEYRFQDPDWLRWWLDSLFMLHPSDQLLIASRLTKVIYAIESRDVLQEFIVLTSAILVHMGGDEASEVEVSVPSVDPVEIEASDEYADMPLWERTMRSAWINYPKPIIGAALVILTYGGIGVYSLYRFIAIQIG